MAEDPVKAVMPAPAILKPDFSFETAVINSRMDLLAPPMVIGFDEAGRGPWAGPVTAAAVWIAPDAIHYLPKDLNDSKTLSRSKRAQIFSALQEMAINPSQLKFGVMSIDAEQIDRDGILPSTFRAMDLAAMQLVTKSSLSRDDALHMLVDGNLAPSFDDIQKRQTVPIAITPIIKGDRRSLSIAAASIVAKEVRDAVMTGLDRQYCGYGWAKNMGYGTKAHQAGLATQGVVKHHRLSYKPVAAIAEKFNYTR